MQGKVHTDFPRPSSTAPPSCPKTSNCGSAEVMNAILVKVLKKKKSRTHRIMARLLLQISSNHPSKLRTRFPSANAFCNTHSSKSCAKLLVRSLRPIFSKSGMAFWRDTASKPRCTIRCSFARAASASSKSTSQEFSPSRTNSRCPWAGCKAHGVPEQSASMTVLPSVSKLEADTNRSLAAYAARNSLPFNIFRKGRTFGRPEAGAFMTVWQYPEVPSPTITNAQSFGSASHSRWIRFSADHLPADRRIARGSWQPCARSFSSHSERKACAWSAHSAGSALNSSDHKIGGHIALMGIPYVLPIWAPKTLDTVA
mmetsp:Transcript_32130/g.76712  ORF Transcript_32130/g.76712 Transcript_32130/m.76712 type:complete len:313 (-) Transcript_32130:548-1486(-)